MDKISRQQMMLILDKQLQNAQKIQQKIIPKPDTFKSPYYSFYSHLKPFTRVGGDFYDFRVFENGNVSLLLVDAMGHGLDAAMLTGMIKLIYFYELRSQSIQLSPSLLLKRIDQEINSLLGFSYFSSVAFLLDPTRQKIYWGNAGHPPGFIIKGGREIVNVEARFPLLGMYSLLNVDNYDDLETSFKPGDKLILYTDGLTDSKNKDGENYGYERIEKLVEKYKSSDLYTICTIIVRDNQEYTEGTEANDDICLIGIQYDEN